MDNPNMRPAPASGKLTDSQLSTFRERDDWLRAVLASDLPHVTARVAVRIGLHLNVKLGRCNPSVGKIATGSSISKRSAHRQIASLERAGWIAVERGGGRERSNHYVLKYGDKAVAPFKPQNGDRADTQTVTDRALNGDTCWQTKSVTAKRKAKEEDGGPVKGSPRPLEREQVPSAHERERAPSAALGSLGDGAAGADAPRAAGEPKKPADAPLTGEILPPEKENTIDALIALWDRGHAADRTPAAQQRTRAAWRQAITVAEPATIFDGARKWIAAADAPRFLPKLADWLDANGWQQPPPKRGSARGGSRAHGRAPRRNGGADAAAYLRQIAEEEG